MAQSVSDQDALRADNERRRRDREELTKRENEDIVRTREEQQKFNVEKMERDAKLRPTPTVEEVQRAMRGHSVDNKEPDGSPEQNPHHPVAPAAAQIEVGRKVSEARPAGEQGTYNTRAARALDNPNPPPTTPPPAPKKD